MSLSMQFILVSDVEVFIKNFEQVAKNQFFDFSEIQLFPLHASFITNCLLMFYSLYRTRFFV